MVFEFPFLPPSVNSMFYTDFANHTRHKSAKYHTRHKSAKYRQFQADIRPFLPKAAISGEVEVEINIYFDTLRRNDLDNRIKPVLDTLVEFGVIDDDSKVVRLVVEKYYAKGKPATVVKVEAKEVRGKEPKVRGK